MIKVSLELILRKVYEYVTASESDTLSKGDSIIINKTIKGVSEDFESMKFNTAISKLMQYINTYKQG